MADDDTTPGVTKVLLTERPTALADGRRISTPEGKDDLKIVVQHWYTQVGIRVARTYLQSLVGLLVAIAGANAIGVNIPVDRFGNVFLQAASLAVPPAVMSLLQNALELLSNLDRSNPELRA